MAKEIEINYKPRNWALKLHESKKRFFSLILHRRAGKTTALMNHMQRAAIDDNWERERMRYLMPHLSDSTIKELIKKRMYGIVFPTYSQAKLVVWDKLKEIAKPIPRIKTNEVDLEV